MINNIPYDWSAIPEYTVFGVHFQSNIVWVYTDTGGHSDNWTTPRT